SSCFWAVGPGQRTGVQYDFEARAPVPPTVYIHNYKLFEIFNYFIHRREGGFSKIPWTIAIAAQLSCHGTDHGRRTQRHRGTAAADGARGGIRAGGAVRAPS